MTHRQNVLVFINHFVKHTFSELLLVMEKSTWNVAFNNNLVKVPFMMMWGNRWMVLSRENDSFTISVGGGTRHCH